MCRTIYKTVIVFYEGKLVAHSGTKNTIIKDWIWQVKTQPRTQALLPTPLSPRVGKEPGYEIAYVRRRRGLFILSQLPQASVSKRIKQVPNFGGLQISMFTIQTQTGAQMWRYR